MAWEDAVASVDHRLAGNEEMTSRIRSATTKDKVILITLGRESGSDKVIEGIMGALADTLESEGVVVNTVRLSDVARVGTGQLCELLENPGTIACISYLGIGAELPLKFDDRQTPVNIWDWYNIPFIKLHGDSPAYFLDRHRDVPVTGVNLYGATEFLHIANTWAPNRYALSATLTPFVIWDTPKYALNLKSRRNGRLVYLKNGNSPKALRDLWAARLPPRVAALLSDLASAILPPALRPSAMPIDQFVEKHLSELGINPHTAGYLVPMFTAQLDDYLRREKGTMVARALMDFPVVVQGDRWDHIDFSNARARLTPSEDYNDARRIFTDELGIIEISPNNDTGPHERLWRAAGTWSLGLTNRQSWLESEFDGLTDISFDYSNDAIQSRVSDVLAHPDRYIELGMEFGAQFRKVYSTQRFVEKIRLLAELTQLRTNPAKPQLQDYFIWPSHGAILEN